MAPPSTNPLYGWLKKQNHWVYGAAPPAGYTHTLLDGGKLAVPDAAADAFLDNYAGALAVSPQFVVELKTPVFRMFMDIDIKSEVPLLDEDLVSLGLFIYNQCYLPWRSTAAASPESSDASGMVIDMRTLVDDPATIRRRAANDASKYGVHLIWQSWFVDCAEAAAFCRACAERCAADFRGVSMPGDLDWKRVLDPSVYKGSGLRMTGSRKPGSAYAYLPRVVVDTAGTVTQVGNPWPRIRHWIDQTTIRLTSSMLYRTLPGTQSTLALPATGEDAAAAAAAGHDDSGAGAMSGFLSQRLQRRANGALQPSSSPSLDEEDESSILAKRHGRFLAPIPTSKVAGITGSLRELVTVPQYKSMKVCNVYCTLGSKEPTFVIGTSSKFCLNKLNGYHNSNHVYFLFSKDGLFQKCFCQCETTAGRKSGMCRDFNRRLLCQLSVRDLYKRLVTTTQVYHGQGKTARSSPVST